MSDIEIIKPFGPSIVKIKMPKEMVDEMNEYSETIIKNNEKSKNLDHGDQLIGKVKQEFLLEIDFMKKIKWAEFLGSAVYKWVGQETNNKIKHFELIKSWIVKFEEPNNKLIQVNHNLKMITDLDIQQMCHDKFLQKYHNFLC